MKRFAGLSEQPTSWCIYSLNGGQSARGTEEDNMKLDENRFLFHKGALIFLSESKVYKAALVEGANEDTWLRFLPGSFNHKAPNSSLTCYFSPSLQNLKIAASL